MPRSVYSDVTTLSGLTTASTLSVHDTLPTPGDERSDPLSYGAAVSKHREFSRVTSALGSAEIFDSYQEASPYIHQTAPNIHIIHASSDDSLMPSVPPTPPPKSPTLAIHRRRSTKELISIYESTSSTPSLNYNTTTSEHPGQYESRNSARSKNQNPKILKTRPSNEGRWNPAAPMRYSFQNLLGVFGRKQRQPTKEFTVFRPPAKIPGLPLISTRPPTALTEGQLLYLCRTSSNAVSWKGCTAALHPPYLRLSFTQPLPGTPLTYSINMSLCVEVHSIGANKLDPSLVPIIAGHNDAHVFEMELEGGMKERFAAWSVKDRGSWVSKIWDIILSQNATDPGSINMATRSTSPVTINQRTDPPLRVINASHLSIVSGSTENRSSAFANASTDSEIPFPAKPSYPQTDLTLSENRSHVFLTERSVPPTFSTSPSIQNLDDRSIVKQRLARIKDQFGGDITSPTRKSLPTISASNHGLAKIAGYHEDRRGSHPGRAPTTNPLPAPRAVYPDQSFTPLPSFTWESLPVERFASPSSLSSYSTSPSQANSVTACLPRVLPMPPSKMFTLHDGDPGDESWRSFAHSIPHSASPRPSTPSITLCSAESAVVQDLSHYTPGQDVSFNDIGERVSALHEDLRHLGSGIAKVISMQNQSDPRGVDAASMPLVLDDLSRVHQKLDALVQGETPLGVPSLHRKLDEIKDDLGGMDLRILSSLQVKLDDLKQIVASNPPSPLPNSEDQSLRGVDFFASEAIMEKLDEVHRMQALGNARPPANLDLSPVLLKLDELRSNHDQDTTSPALALVLKKLDELREETTVRTASNEAPRENKDAGAIQLAPDDLSDVRTKLDDVMELCRSLTADHPSPSPSPMPELLGRQLSVFRRGSRANRHHHISPVSEDSPDEPSLGVPNESESNLLQQIFDVLNQEKDHQESQRTQQLESVRYLHELNQWLEQFVHQHTSQTQSLNQGVTRLLDGLGLSGTVVDDSDARRDIVSLLAEVHHTVLDLKQRESGHSALQNTVNMLIHKVNEDLERISAERKAMTSELMVSMFAQQREEQQLFVRALATDLTNQIRGERMQFVDAMKEVTSVNLKAQVLETTRILAGLSQTIREQQVP